MSIQGQVSRIVKAKENYVLNGMLMFGIWMGVYTGVRHVMTAPDISIDRQSRDHGDDLASNPRYTEKANSYTGGVYGWVHKFWSGM